MSETGTNGLRQRQAASPLLYKLFTIVFALLFSGVLLLVIFANTNTFYPHKWYWLLLAAAVGVVAVLLLSRLFAMLPSPSAGAEAIFVALWMVLLLAAQVFIGLQLRVNTTSTWDFGIVYSYAEDYVLHGTLPGDYFLNFANNTGIYTLWCGFFSLVSLFGVYDFFLPALFLNILCIDAAVLMLYFCARRLFGKKKALFILVCAVFALPLLLYVPIFYTDTLTLPFPVGVVLLWLHGRSHYRAGRFGKAMTFFCVLSVLAALGGVLKLTVVIVWIAVALDLLILMRGAKRLLVLLAGGVLCALVLWGGNWFSRHSPMLPKYDYNNGIPFTHWIMMGLSGQGGYNDADYQFTLEGADKAQRYAMTVEEIQLRLGDMGPIGILQHLGTKLSYTFGDGTYTATGKLDRDSASTSFLHNFVIFTEPGFRYTAYIAFGMQAALLFWMVAAAVKAIWRKNYSLTFVRVAVFGLTIFLLLWETRARYLLNYLPLFMLCALEAAPMPVPVEQRKNARAALVRRGPAPAPEGPALEPDAEALPEAPAEGGQGAEEPEVTDAPAQPLNLFDDAEHAAPADAAGPVLPPPAMPVQQGPAAPAWRPVPPQPESH